MHEVSKEGRLIRTIDFPEYRDSRTNGICYDESDDSLWILFTRDYLIHTDKDGTVMAFYKVDYPDQDMICLYDGMIYITAGADYQGRDNYLYIFDTEKGELNNRGYRLLDSYAWRDAM